MEQYEIPANRYLKNIQKALKHFQAEWVYCRFVGSQGGKVVISKDIKDRKLTISRGKNGLDIKIDGKKVFFYEITKKGGIDFGNRWSIAYERFDSAGRMHHAHTGYPNFYAPYTGPDDPALPEVKKTVLRSCNRDYLIEITFSGKIPIKNIGLIQGHNDWYNWEIDLGGTKMAKIYMICSVRKATEEEEKKIIAYAEKLRNEGHEVRCPLSDTNQADELGLRIVEEHENEIIWADEIHIIWNPASEGSLWDVAQARMARRFMPEKKIVVVNVSEVKITDTKSYANVILATHFGLKAGCGLDELKIK